MYMHLRSEGLREVVSVSTASVVGSGWGHSGLV